MRKREEMRKRRQQRARRQTLTLALVVGGIAVVFAGLLALPTLRTALTPVGVINTAEPEEWPQANGKTLGSPEAPVLVQEFSDFQWPYCALFARGGEDRSQPSVERQIIDNYVRTGKARLEYHHYIVIDGNVGGTESRHAAEASECAAQQNRFWEYNNLLFANQAGEGSGAFADKRLTAMAEMLGLDMNAFNSCFRSSQAAAAVSQDEALAQQFGLNSTPSLLINSQKVPNPIDYAAIAQQIDSQLPAQP